MKIKELRNKSEAELQKDLIAFKKELFNLRFQKVQGHVEKPHRTREVRRAVARVKTLLSALNLAAKTEKKVKIAKPASDSKKKLKKVSEKPAKKEIKAKKPSKKTAKKAAKKEAKPHTKESEAPAKAKKQKTKKDK
jgi:large subunit ribosomal protein L29